ncbi:hypothetical protein CI109_104199 [Kwoniella shandongensis]|uniref:Conserved oligomeric Golgi complex subunit 2 n=1 Tax=Kwoniella shandongensis TaxID=1734106 RepID=A0A5M6C4K4_9TREE|nr:uncharacterized protein CI109_002890 [Kwoniella shandongensis]KAA5528732.1 hypothetical protein CI109_002890 [Kwoniella shandongensis]
MAEVASTSALRPPSPEPRLSTSSSTSSQGRSLDLPSLQPLSHSHPLLTAETFDADTFLLSRIHIPLEELRGELRSYLGELREELVQLINEDYEEFISLGTGLRGEEGRLKRLEGPLEDVRQEVEGVRDVLAEHQTKVQSKLEERAGLREEKALLDLLQRLFDTLSRAETLLDQASDEEHGSAKMVTRVAGEYTQVVYLLNKARAEGCAIVSVVEERIEKIKSRISKDLSTLLTAELRDPSIPMLKQCLKTYELIEGWEEAEEVIRKSVREFCRDTITPAALNGPTSPTVPQTPHALQNPFDRSLRLPTTDNSALAGLYNRVLAQVETYQPVMTIAEDISERFDFFARVIWPEISETVMERLGGVIFSAGRPDELHKHYTTTHSFISLLENLAPSSRSVTAMRSSPFYESFERRWQLPVYFQLRWKEVVGSLEASLASSAAVGDDGKDGWALGQSSAVWKALETCWSEEVYIPELAPRFWRLSLQIIARYGTHLKSLMDNYNIGEEDTSQEDAALKFAASAITDLDKLSTKSGDLEVVKTLGLSNHLTLPTTHYSEKVLLILTRRSTDPLKLIRSIASQFRASPSPTPSSSSSSSIQQPSYFIPTVLKPLHTLFSSRPALKDKYQVEWSTQVFDSVCQNYASILTSVRKTEDLLRKHRKSKKSGFSSFFGGAGGGGSTTPGAEGAVTGEEKEEERFSKQMKVDIEALKSDAEGLGVNVEELESWKELVSVVNKSSAAE